MLGGDKGKMEKGEDNGELGTTKKEFLGERRIQEGEKERIEYEALDIRNRKKQEKERERKIRDLRYNKWYSKVRGEGRPDYLKRRWMEKS